MKCLSVCTSQNSQVSPIEFCGDRLDLCFQPKAGTSTCADRRTAYRLSILTTIILYTYVTVGPICQVLGSADKNILSLEKERLSVGQYILLIWPAVHWPGPRFCRLYISMNI